jgi:hypothetical protein
MDMNVRAFRVAQEAINGQSPVQSAKKAAARKGGLAGGPSRARAISAARRLEIAQKANKARWAKASAAKKQMDQAR